MEFKVVYANSSKIGIDSEAILDLGVVYIEKPANTEEEVISLAHDADVLIVRGEPCTRKVIENLKSCKLIVTPKVGYENIDVVAATEMGICVANTGGMSAMEVSEHAMALLLTCARKIIGLDKMIRSGEWHVFHGPEMRQMWQGISRLHGQTLGIIGFGPVSRLLALKAKAFGLNILIYDPHISRIIMDVMGVRPVELTQLLKESDYVSINVPLTQETYHMLGLSEFKLMKPTAYLINTARGAVVNEEELNQALTRGYIAGAALDVLENEPISMDNPLLKLENVIFTGHSAHYSDEAWLEQNQQPAVEISRIMSGKYPWKWVNPEVEKKYAARWVSNKPSL